MHGVNPDNSSERSSTEAPSSTIANSSDIVTPLRIATIATPQLRSWRITPEGLEEVDPSTMGAFLDKPKTTKSNHVGEGKDIRYAVASMQGWRTGMEDAHVVEVSMAERFPFKDWSFFAVFDGHAGNVAADQSAEHLLKTLLDTPDFSKVTSILAENGSELTQEVKDLLESGIKDGFLKLDEYIRQRLTSQERDRSGTTAVCAILTPTHIILANLGDSRAVISRRDEPSFATDDHKPYNDKERERIVGAGGSVMIQRINGSLAVSRALGDFEYKAVPGLCPTKQLVSCEPDVYFLERHSDKDQFMVVACDGIYDVMENDDLCKFVEDRLQVSGQLDHVSNQVLDVCLSRGSRDNMTMILVCFPNAPKIDLSKQELELKWVDDVKNHIKEVIDEEISSESWSQEDEMSIGGVLRQLATRVNTEVEGAATHLLRTLVDDMLTERGIAHDQ